MKKKIPCICDNTFEVEIDVEYDLDRDGKYLDEILNGSFLNFTCPGCGKNNKPEFRLSVIWSSKKLRLEVFPELERGEFYRRKELPAEKGPNVPETIIGYPELADRLSVIRDGFDPVPVEAIKYNLQLKAEEQFPDNDMEVWYYGSGTEKPNNYLEFHIHGIKENEVAVMKVPFSVYERTLDDYRKHPKNEIFTALRFRSYLSYRNTMHPGAL